MKIEPAQTRQYHCPETETLCSKCESHCEAAQPVQPAVAQEPVSSEPYAWIYVDQYGLDSKSAAKEWCQEMIRLHGGSMFPLYTRPPQTAQKDPVAYRVTVNFMGKTREFFTDLCSVAESLKTHYDGFIQPLYTEAPAVAQPPAEVVRELTKAVQQMRLAIEWALDWDTERNFVMPYKVRDPMRAALKSAKEHGL